MSKDKGYNMGGMLDPAALAKRRADAASWAEAHRLQRLAEPMMAARWAERAEAIDRLLAIPVEYRLYHITREELESERYDRHPDPSGPMQIYNWSCWEYMVAEVESIIAQSLSLQAAGTPWVDPWADEQPDAEEVRKRTIGRRP